MNTESEIEDYKKEGYDKKTFLLYINPILYSDIRQKLDKLGICDDIVKESLNKNFVKYLIHRENIDSMDRYVLTKY